jgi:F0F1-type ATP synthase assembly protein I
MQAISLAHGFHPRQPKTPRQEAEAMTLRRFDFFAYTCVGISLGSLTGFLVDYPLPWTIVSIVIAYAMAKQP